MSDDNKKTMTPELLPDPKRARGHALPPRARVRRHMTELMKFGVGTLTMASCVGGFMAVDPAPPPAVCLDNDAGFRFSADAQLLTYGTVRLTLNSNPPNADGSIHYRPLPSVIGATVVGTNENEFLLQPDGSGGEITVEFDVFCEDWRTQPPDAGFASLRVVIEAPVQLICGDAGTDDAGARDAGSDDAAVSSDGAVPDASCAPSARSLNVTVTQRR